MSTLYFDETASLGEAVKRIQQRSETELELKFAQGSVFWQSLFNQKLLSEVGRDLGKKISISQPSSPPAADDFSRQSRSSNKQAGHSRPKLSSGRFVLLGISLVMALFLAGGLTFVYFYLPKAEIILEVEEKILQQATTVTIDPKAAQVDVDLGVLPGKSVSVQEEKKEVFAATGEKEVGDKAQGQITIRNWTDQPLVLDVGAKVSVKNNPELVFSLDQEATVPAQEITGDQPDERTYVAGKASAAVVASEIGEEYNLAAGQELILENLPFNNFPATNESAFSGGSRRQITVVSEDDQTRARQQLLSLLSAQAKKDLESKLLGDQEIIPESVQDRVVAEEYDQKVGSEVNQFYLTLTTQTTAISYSQSQLGNLLADKMKGAVPEGFVFSGTDEKVAIQNVRVNKAGNYELDVDHRVLVVPNVDQIELARQLKGQKPEQAQTILGRLPNLKGYQVNLWPRLPRILQTLPYRLERIQIAVETR